MTDLNRQAVEAAATAMRGGHPHDGSDCDYAVLEDVHLTLATYFASLAEQGIVLVDLNEVVEALREVDAPLTEWGSYAASFIEDRFAPKDGKR